MVPVLIALGSNVGNPLEQIQQAVDRLSEFVDRMRVSGVYRTAPMYVEDQADFLNAAASGLVDIGPLELLNRFKAIENDLHRLQRVRYGPREIDIDLLSYGALSIHSERLQVPHPRMRERRFVLLPLLDVAPARDVEWIREGLVATEGQSSTVQLLADATLSVPGTG